MSAIISPCGRYRYRLERDLGVGTGTVVFVMLNPSTADAALDDPTIRRCLRFANDWGYRRLVVVNLAAFRATSPKDMLAAEDPYGPENDAHITAAFREADKVVVAWGNEALRLKRRPAIWHLFKLACEETERPLGRLWCLKESARKQPVHPLYQPANTVLQPWAS